MMETRPADSGIAGGGGVEDREQTYLKFTSVPGYFMQSLPTTDPKSFDFKEHNFGLISQSYDSATKNDMTSWQRFASQLSRLNVEAAAGTTYRLLFLGRHGQGYHNVAESYYGTEAWNCYWSTLEGNDSVTWFDARLTGLGRQQAQENHDYWSAQHEEEKMPAVQSWYVSPMDRTIETAEITWRRLSAAYRPLVKELVREGNGVHTCDKRSPRSAIRARWPKYDFEKGFSEEDELWKPDLRESPSAHEARMLDLFDNILSRDDSTYISLTTHSGTIAAILRVVGHREFALQTGGIIPVLLKVEKVAGRRPQRQVEPWQPKPECKGDPLAARLEGYQSFQEYLDGIERTAKKDDYLKQVESNVR